MNCKNCGKELEEDEIICGQCGEDNSPETEEAPSGINPWKIAFPVTLSLGLLLILSWLVYFGVTGSFLPRANDIFNKDSYTYEENRVSANRNKVVATMGEDKLTNGQLQVFYGVQVINYLNTNGADFNYTDPLDEQIYNEKTGVTWQQYFLESALNTWKQYRLLANRGQAEGYEIPESYQEALDNTRERLQSTVDEDGLESIDALIQKDMGYGCTFEDYMYYMELHYYANLYYSYKCDQIEVSDAEVEAYFAANEEFLEENGFTKDSGLLVDFRHILIKPEADSAGNASDGAWNDCYLEADALMSDWRALGFTEESFVDLAAEYSDDSSTSANGGLMAYITEDYLTTVDIRHILIMPEGGTASEDGKTTVYSDAEWEACRKKAQEIYDTYLAGDRTEESFSDLAVEHSKDGNAEDGGIYTDVTKDYMVEEFDAWIFDKDREPGDTGILKTDYGYHVMYFVHRDGEINDWAFDEDRKSGDYELLKADDGYHLVYFVEGEEGWIRVSEAGVLDEKSDELLQEITGSGELNVNYSKIRLGVADLG